MMLATTGLRVALVTTHLPLKDISNAITESRLTSIINILNSELQVKYAIKKPRIYVCGLNPHAGEGGHMGREEIETITPTEMFEPIGPYSHLTKVGPFITISGTPGVDPNTLEMAGADAYS